MEKPGYNQNAHINTEKWLTYRNFHSLFEKINNRDVYKVHKLIVEKTMNIFPFLFKTFETCKKCMTVPSTTVIQP